MSFYPTLLIKKAHKNRVSLGSPWIFSNEIENFAELKQLDAGSIVSVALNQNDSRICKENFATAYFNPHSLIAARILSYDIFEAIDNNFFIRRINAALDLRQKFHSKSFYRLVHSEGDFLPGLVIDRFDKVFVCQISTAGMEKLSKFLVAALKKIFPDCLVVFKNNSEARKLENLSLEDDLKGDEIPEKIQVLENEIEFLVNIKSGQKTGWYFDQQQNREFVGKLVSNLVVSNSVLQNKNQGGEQEIAVLDAFCYVGGFGINALKSGADRVCFIDSSSEALQLAKENCEKLLQGLNFHDLRLNKNSPHLEFSNNKVFDELQNLSQKNQKFDLVLLDPPPFIKSKKDYFSGLRGYEKLVKLAVPMVKAGGFLILSSCSHHCSESDLVSAAKSAFLQLKINANLIQSFGAGFDHPVHLGLPQNQYLKSLVFKLS